MLNSLGESCYEGVKLLAELVRAAGSTELPDVSAVADSASYEGARGLLHGTTTSTSPCTSRWPTGSSSPCSASCDRGSTSVPRGKCDSYSGLGTTRTDRCWRPITPCETEGSINRDSACRTPSPRVPKTIINAC